ncbi:MAG: hypothetical protein JOY61_24425 [Chloroflexi bacterium]|nr:hypothetical protein [Chloroflexota bacterium]
MSTLRKAANVAYKTNRILLDAEAIRRGRYPQRVVRRHVNRRLFRLVNRLTRWVG